MLRAYVCISPGVRARGASVHKMYTSKINLATLAGRTASSPVGVPTTSPGSDATSVTDVRFLGDGTCDAVPASASRPTFRAVTLGVTPQQTACISAGSAGKRVPSTSATAIPRWEDIDPFGAHNGAWFPAAFGGSPAVPAPRHGDEAWARTHPGGLAEAATAAIVVPIV